MNIFHISGLGIEPRPADDLKSLLAVEDGFVWVDLAECDEHGTQVLSEVFGFHPLAVQHCRERSHVPRLHVYPDTLFVVLHAPEPDTGAHVHLLELDQFIGRRFLVTVHGPLGAGVAGELALRETQAVLQRMRAGRYRPGSPAELSYAIVSAITRHMEGLVSGLATKIAMLERQVREGRAKNPEHALEAMFRLRHELLTIRTIAAHSREVCARIAALAPRFMQPEERALVDDLTDQFERVRGLCDAEQAFLQGVIDFFQNRTITKLNIAMERLALITVLLLPVTAIASVYGMNIIVFPETNLAQVAGVLGVIVLMMVLIFFWAKRQGWW
jgi:Mg2+ and Co2+ transporter CorA